MTSAQQGSREYDVIIAGGGTAACVVAGRLAEADPGLSILVVEQGPNNLDDVNVVNPALHLNHLLPGSKTAIFYQGNEEACINGRAAIVPAGGMLGGGSSINFMMYVRAQGRDYDSWNIEGWDAKSLIPFARKLETFHFRGPAFDESLHGYAGPIAVSHGPCIVKDVQDDLLAGAEAAGFREIVDMQDFKASNGFSRCARYVSRDGKRQDTAHCYLHPKMASGNYPNLHVLVEKTVSRVVFEGNRAVGIEYYPSKSSSQGTGSDTGTIVRARKLVVVSAGCLGTPQVLERSGVGSKEILDKLDIPVVSHLPGVGEEYQDHNLMSYVSETNLPPDKTLDAVMSGRLDYEVALREGNPILGWNGVDLSSKVRPTEAEVAELGPDFQELWNRDFRNQTDRPLMIMALTSFDIGHPREFGESMGGSEKQYISMTGATTYPYSRGNIHIVSRDAFVPASFNSGFLSHPADIKMLLWGYKKLRDIVRRTNAFVADVPSTHPNFPPGSSASATNKHPNGGAYPSQESRRAVPPIEYNADDDAAIEDFIRSNMQTTWHSLGTCKMAPRENGGVVDKHLNVHGTERLKLADLSICPENVGANTNNTALIIGEKAAYIIGKELGLSISA